jgi:hypothetical protein
VRGDGATNTVTNGRTNEKGQLVVTVTMAGSTTGTITAIPDTGQASLKATATVSSYRLGELGPGDGLVFLIANGKTYEMASRPRNNAVPNSKCISIDVDPNCFLPDPKAIWCDKASSSLPGTGTEVGTGRTNTALMMKGCIAGGTIGSYHLVVSWLRWRATQEPVLMAVFSMSDSLLTKLNLLNLFTGVPRSTPRPTRRLNVSVTVSTATSARTGCCAFVRSDLFDPGPSDEMLV